MKEVGGGGYSIKNILGLKISESSKRLYGFKRFHLNISHEYIRE